MPNAILTPQMITREALRILHNKLTFISRIVRQYDDRFAKDGAKIGDTLQIRLPNEYKIRRGRNLSAQDTNERKVNLQVANQAGVDTQFYSSELTLSLDDFSERILEPAMSVLAANMEADAFTLYGDVAQLVGTPGTIPATLKVFLDARARLNNSLAPFGKRNIQMTPETNATMVDALKGLFQDSEAIKEQYAEGMMGRTSGFDWFENPLMPTHTNGNKVAGVTVNGASQTGTTLNIGGVAAADTFKRGTVFTIANVFEVHPETKAVTNRLKQFVVTADATMAGTTGSISILPAIDSAADGRQNVNASPANSAPLTFVGAASTSWQQNIAHHKEAFAFVTADLVMPKGVDFSHREVMDGLSMRIVRAYDINTDNFPCRIDVLYGYQTLRPQLACRITQ